MLVDDFWRFLNASIGKLHLVLREILRVSIVVVSDLHFHMRRQIGMLVVVKLRDLLLIRLRLRWKGMGTTMTMLG
jgi:hypothetical protein